METKNILKDMFAELTEKAVHGEKYPCAVRNVLTDTGITLRLTLGKLGLQVQRVSGPRRQRYELVHEVVFRHGVTINDIVNDAYAFINTNYRGVALIL